MTASLAGLLVLYLYRRLVERSLADDPVTAQLVEKNAVLLLSILILFHGIYRSQEFSACAGGWRAAGAVVAGHGLVSYLAHPRRAELGRPSGRTRA